MIYISNSRAFDTDSMYIMQITGGDMQEFSCEICGNSKFFVDSGRYICCTCGKEYAAEAADRLKDENKADRLAPEELAHLTELARQARDEGNIADSAKYYEQLVKQGPTSWESFFFSVYFKQIGCRVSQTEHAANTIKYAVDTTVALIDNLPDEEKADAYKTVAEYVQTAADTFKNAAYAHYRSHLKDGGIEYEYSTRAAACSDLIIQCGLLLNNTEAGKEAAAMLTDHDPKDNASASHLSAKGWWYAVIMLVVIAIIVLSSTFFSSLG